MAGKWLSARALLSASKTEHFVIRYHFSLGLCLSVPSSIFLHFPLLSLLSPPSSLLK